MVRGAEFDNNVPASDNPVENGPNKAHGVGNEDAPLNRTQRTADLPEAATTTGGQTLSGGGSAGPTQAGSGKGGHDPKSAGEHKGFGAQPGQ